MTTTAPIHDFAEGQNYPSPVTQIIGLGYYDGVTSGILRTAGGSIYVFDLVGESQGSEKGEDVRRFELKALPPASFDRIVAAIAAYHPPSWPVWVPLWKFPDPQSQATVDSVIEEETTRAMPPAWVVEASDLSREIISAQRPDCHQTNLPVPSNGSVRMRSLSPTVEPEKK